MSVGAWSRKRLVTTALGLVLLGGLGSGPVAVAAVPPVEAPTLEQIQAEIRIERDGSLRVRETERYDFHDLGPGMTRRTFATRLHYDADHDQVFEISGLKASVGGRPMRVEVDDSERSSETTYALRFAEAPRGRQTITLDYVVRGAIRETPEGPELGWPVVLGLATPAERVTVTVAAPAVSWAACIAGRPGSSMPCTATQLGELTRPRFDQDRLATDERMTIMLGMPADVGVSADQLLVRRWSLGRAFAVTPVSLGFGLGLVALAGLAVFLLWWTRGRDAEARREQPAEGPEPSELLTPPDSVRPGQLGTVVDERADVVDIVATVLDLAVRGRLRIERLDGGDWRLHRIGGDTSDLHDYERALLVVLFAGTSRDNVELSALGEQFSEGLADVRGRLYADVVAQGWFAQRPDAARARWTTAGVVLALAGVVVTLVLAAFTELGLVGLGLVLAGAILAGGGEVAPARTSRGTTLLRKLHAFRSRLADVDVSSVRPESAERLVPYAVVFGVEERWAGTARSSETLPSELEPFVTALSGTISAAHRLRF